MRILIILVITLSMLTAYLIPNQSTVNAQMMTINENDNSDVKEATQDYYNEIYKNTLVVSNQSQFQNQTSVNITHWETNLSNNGWTIAQSWIQTNSSGSNPFVTFSDNGGRNYSNAEVVCPGGTDKRTGIYGGEFWILCTKKVGSVNNVFIQETRTHSTPVSDLTNLSVEMLKDARILDFNVNSITGMVTATWTEGNTTMGGGHTGFIETYCYRC
ncbi:MAG TPA: hypothetical protein VJU13_03330 [Candidatus Nitrosocosmicus sp.]|nr:hypothetical protein [Candidatus Nitrosocosmicus sp.]